MPIRRFARRRWVVSRRAEAACGGSRSRARLAHVGPEIASLVGVAVGGTLAFLGNLFIHRQSSKAAEAARAHEREALAREERKQAYLSLLRSARELRYLARLGSSADRAAVDAARTELATAAYEIELIAAPSMAKRAEKVRKRVGDYWSAAREAPAVDPQGRIELVAGIKAQKKRARAAVNDFVRAARGDLEAAQDVVSDQSLRVTSSSGGPPINSD